MQQYIFEFIVHEFMCTKIRKTAYIRQREKKSPGVVFMVGSYLLLLLTIVGRDYESEHFVCVYELCFLKKHKNNYKMILLRLWSCTRSWGDLVSNWVKNYRGDSRVVKFWLFLIVCKLKVVWFQVFACYRQTGNICHKLNLTHGIIVDLSLSNSIYQ